MTPEERERIHDLPSDPDGALCCGSIVKLDDDGSLVCIECESSYVGAVYDFEDDDD